VPLEGEDYMGERLKWFKEARFGMFIHWGVYPVIGRGEGEREKG